MSTITNKIIDTLKSLLKDDKIFYGALLTLVGLTSFGLGRMSISENSLNLSEGQSYTATVAEGSTVGESTKEFIKAKESTPLNPETLATEATYVGSKNSDKYHLLWCSGAKRIAEENKIFFKSKEEAEKAGYKPAGNCPGI